MTRLLHWIGFRHLARRPVRTALTVSAIALGTALLAAVQAVNGSVSESFKERVGAISGEAALSVHAGASGFAESHLETLIDLPGVEAAIPLIEAKSYRFRTDGGREPLQVLGIDFTDKASLGNYQEGLGEAMGDWLEVISSPDHILLTRRFAEERGLKIGSRVVIAAPGGKRELTVRALLADEGPARAFGGAIAFMDIDAARVQFQKRGKIDRINLLLDGSIPESGIRQSIREKLGPAFEVENTDEQGAEMESSVKAFEMLLGFFGSLAFLIAVLLVAHSVSISIGERRSEIGLLRAMGATRPLIFFSLVSEVAAISFLSSLLGALIGVLIAASLLGAASRAMSVQAQMSVNASTLEFGPEALVLAIAAGVCASLIAVVVAAWKMSRTPLLELIGSGPARFVRSSASKGAVSGGVGAVLLAFHYLSNSPVLGPAAGFIGALLAGAALSEFLIRSWNPPLGLVSRLAWGNLARNAPLLRRNIMSLMTGLMLVVLVGTAKESFRGTLGSRFGATVREDLIVSSTGQLVSGEIQTISEDIGPEIARIPGVDVGPAPRNGAYGLRVSSLTYAGAKVGIKAFDEPGPEIQYANFDLIDRPADRAGPELYHSSDLTVFVSETFAQKFSKRTGEMIVLSTPSGPVSARIVGTVVDFSAGGGFVIMSRSWYKKLWNDSLVTGFGVKVQKGVDPEEVRARIERLIGGPKGLTVTSNRELKDQMLGAIDSGFSSLRAIELAALLAGILGVVNAMLVGVMSRRRELAMLRALGMTEKHVSRMVVTETLIQGLMATVLASVFGLWIAREWITHSLMASFGWLVSFDPSWVTLIGAAGAGLVAALVASGLPARQAAKTRIVEGLQHE